MMQNGKMQGVKIKPGHNLKVLCLLVGVLFIFRKENISRTKESVLQRIYILLAYMMITFMLKNLFQVFEY